MMNINALWQITYQIQDKSSKYHDDPKYSDRQACVNSLDPDQMLHSVAYHQGLHSLLLFQQFYRHINR